MAKKLTYDFSTQLYHLRKGRPFCGQSLGLGPELFNDDKQWKDPLPVGTVLELILLYAKRDEQTPKDKRESFAAALKVRDCDTAQVTEENVEAMRRAIEVMPVEPMGLLEQFLDNPSEETQ